MDNKGAMNEQALSVTQATNLIKETLEKNVNRLWIQGEISNYSCPASGHIYFTLKDENSQIKAAMFGGARKAESLQLEDGKKIAIFGRISIYGKRSEYQIIAEDIQVIGIGGLLAEFEKLKKRLSEEGLFDRAHKIPIPGYPQNIAIITSISGAAIRDILNILTRRYPDVHVLIVPVMVQGREAPPQIIKALQDTDDLGQDVIILTRGGGSIEDLWAFNDEALARAIYAAKTPVISAVGHEIDFTIADFVADLRAPTPSAAAELVVPDRIKLMGQLSSNRDRLRGAIDRLVEKKHEKLTELAGRYAFKVPFDMYENLSREIDDVSVRLNKAFNQSVNSADDEITVLNDKLKLLNPLNILKKGYSVVYDVVTGSILKDSEKAGKEIKVRLYKGTLDAEVKKKI
ncbi:MAG: exodeoxyribonuclease VII large subunit [Spirochaetia bacterium]|nr:exodeoxyribonuclease VII large subunit [Spirochaetia bacterium]